MKRLIHLCTICALVLFPSFAAAQESPILTTDELISIVGEAVVEEASDASEEVRKAKEILDAVKKAGNAEEQEQAQKDLEAAEERYGEASAKLDEARVDSFARESGKSPSEIQAMRDSGMGWGRIAKEVGIHPSASGKGKGKGRSKNKGKSRKKNTSFENDNDSIADNDNGTTEDEEEELLEETKKKGKGKPKGKGKSKNKGKGKKK